MSGLILAIQTHAVTNCERIVDSRACTSVNEMEIIRKLEVANCDLKFINHFPLIVFA